MNAKFGTRPDSLLEEELKMKEPKTIDWSKARMKLRISEEVLKMKEQEQLTFETGVFLMSAPIPEIEKIHINGPCTVIIWSDKTKTMVRLQEGEVYDAEKAIYAAIAKKFIGTNKNKSNWLDIIREKMPDESHNDDIKCVKQLLNNIYGAHKNEI